MPATRKNKDRIPMATITVYMPEQLREALEKAADIARRPISNFVATLIEEKLFPKPNGGKRDGKNPT
jgi:CopG antitoxin of type II toxin-antitoxin system